MITLAFFIWIICGVLAYNMGKERTVGAGAALALGLTLGIIGVIIVAFFPKIETAQYVSMSQPQQQSDLSAAEELKKWHDLKESGVITEDEFQEKKRQLLG